MICRVWFSLLDEHHRIIDTPILEYKSYIDVPTIVDNLPTNLTIIISVETRLASMLQLRAWRFTDADQQKLYSGDKYFEFLPQMKEKIFAWGRGFTG